MKMVSKIATTFTNINSKTKKNGLSVSKLFNLLGKRSNYVLSFVAFSLVALPLPTPPGFSTMLAVPIIFITIQMVIGRDKIILPKFLSKIMIKKSIIRVIDNVCKKYLSKIEKLTHKRLLLLINSKFYVLYNILLLIFALYSAIPIPFLCMIPAIAGMLLSAGLIVKDGFLIMISTIIGFIGIFAIFISLRTLFLVKDIFVL